MDIQKQKEYFASLEKELTDRGLEPVRVDGAGSPQVGDTIRFLLPMSDEGGMVMMELLILDLGEEEFLLEGSLLTAGFSPFVDLAGPLE